MKKIFLCIILSIFLCACSNKNNETPRTAVVLKVQDEKEVLYKTFSGIVISDVISDLSFNVEGQIEKIYVQTGDMVKKGQILARLNNELYVLEADENKMRVQDAIVQYDNAKNYFSRIDKLHKEGGISDSDWDRAYTNMQSAQYQIKIARDKLSYAAKKSGYGTLIAPYDGQIASKLLYEGTYVKPSDGVLKFQGGKFSEIQIFVPQNYINYFYVGKKAKILFDSIPEKTYFGKIKSIAPSSNAEPAYVVKIIMPEKHPEVKDGMSANVGFDFKNLKNTKGGIYIPVTSILKDEKQSFVWVVQNIENGIGTAEKRPVQLGELKSNVIEILNGLTSGNLVVIKGTGQIQAGQKIKVSFNLNEEGN